MKQYEELEFRDDFIFGKVMRNKRLCRKTLERVLDMPIENIEYPDLQKTLNITAAGKSVRLDVYVMDDKQRVYDSEMQQKRAGKEKELPKRSRYYQGVIDLNLLEKGVAYHKLNESYVIFICTFDPFGKGLGRYTFKNMCQEYPGLEMGDETTKIYLNTKYTVADGLTPELQAFLDYVERKQATDEFTKDLDREVNRVRQNKEWRREYMKTILHDFEIKEEARQEGLHQGEVREVIRITLSMLQRGMSVEVVADMLGKATEDIARIRQLAEQYPAEGVEELAERFLVAIV